MNPDGLPDGLQIERLRDEAWARFQRDPVYRLALGAGLLEPVAKWIWIEAYTAALTAAHQRARIIVDEELLKRRETQGSA